MLSQAGELGTGRMWSSLNSSLAVGSAEVELSLEDEGQEAGLLSAILGVG